LEVFETINKKLLYKLAKLWPFIFIFLFYGASFVALIFAIKKIEISVAYAGWSGISTALISLIGILYCKEVATA